VVIGEIGMGILGVVAEALLEGLVDAGSTTKEPPFILCQQPKHFLIVRRVSTDTQVVEMRA